MHIHTKEDSPYQVGCCMDRGYEEHVKKKQFNTPQNAGQPHMRILPLPEGATHVNYSTKKGYHLLNETLSLLRLTLNSTAV